MPHFFCIASSTKRQRKIVAQQKSKRVKISSPHDPSSISDLGEVDAAQISENSHHECSVCGKKFSRRHHLTIHSRIHSGEKPFKCNECGKEFTHSYSFNRHKRIHTGERPYECTVCSMKFNTSSSLQRHSLTHSGEKAFK